ncbi:metal-dependent hydrolase [Agromyces seonyuensis]|uniref:Metal-dependent hydrolase n=1 Tax=Agromyces seonyuensis TaxID=2662446 RepID=A0A6I4NVB5_9MICO|nr:metal-dependent hydrolase [Agromyces seonyuensis]MWB98250.1 metal-dependent hydrolase [Agromyces seonyuensis]
MMGISHATSGAAAWVAVTAAVPIATGWYPLDPLAVVIGSFVCAGAALLPDADHHSGTIAYSVPVLGKLATRTIGALTGGHRKGAHTPTAVLVAVLLALLLGLIVLPTEDYGDLAVGAAMGAAALIAFGLKARDFVRNWPAAWFVGGAAGAAVMFAAPEQFGWFPLAVGIGYGVHLAGDFLTTGGLPGALWPWLPKPPERWKDTPVLNDLWLPSGYLALPVLGDTGSFREKLLTTALAAYTVVVLLVALAQLLGIPVPGVDPVGG